MKKLFLVLFAFAFIAVASTSCKTNGNAALVNKWAVVDFASPSIDKMIAEQMAAIDTIKNDSMKATMKEMANKMIENRNKEMKEMRMEFKADGTYTNTGGQAEPDNGKYTVNGKTLITTSASGVNDSIEITSVSADQLVLTARKGADVLTITMKPDAAK